MIKQKYLLSLISLSLLIPTIIYADCTKEEIDNFKEIQDEYKVTYEFDKDTKLYILTFYSPNPDMYDFISEDETVFSNCEVLDDNTAKCSNVKPNTYNFELVGVTTNCNETLKKIEITLPKHNEYYNDPLCEGIEEFVLCQPTYDKDIDYDTFVSRVNSYKKNHQNKPIDNNTKGEVKEQNKLIQYIHDNSFQIIIIVIFIIMVIITIILTAKSIKKSRRLE